MVGSDLYVAAGTAGIYMSANGGANWSKLGGTTVPSGPVWMSIAGGVLTLGLLVWHRARRRDGRPQIPYGVAIAFGGLAILAQRFLNQFA